MRVGGTLAQTDVDCGQLYSDIVSEEGMQWFTRAHLVARQRPLREIVDRGGKPLLACLCSPVGPDLPSFVCGFLDEVAPIALRGVCTCAFGAYI